MNTSGKLNPNHEKFCKIYAICGNSTRSYLEVYPNSSYDAARASGSALLSNPNILARVEEYRELNKSDTVLILNNLKKRFKRRLVEAFDDVDLMMDEVRKRLKDSNNLTVSQLQNLSRIQTNEISNFFKVVECICQLEGIHLIEDNLIDSLGKIDKDFSLTELN